MGTSKIIEYNIKMEGYRLINIKNNRLEVSRGAICIQDNKLLIIGGLQESKTIDDIIIF